MAVPAPRRYPQGMENLPMRLPLVLLGLLVAVAGSTAAEIPATVGAADGAPWTRYTIDDSSQGADGVKLGDLDGDGRLDIATAWEEGNVVRAYLNPGPAAVRKPWPRVTVGTVEAGEDAIIADLDGDGVGEVVSCAETGAVHLHRLQGGKGKVLDAAAWKTAPFPATAGHQWMQAVAMDIDGQQGLDLMLGAKLHQPVPGKAAVIGWLQAPAKPLDPGAWTFRKLRDAEWTMSLIACDMDRDGDLDLVFTDRNGARSGAYWLEHPGKEAVRAGKPWPEHAIGAVGRKDVMFADVGDIDGDGLPDVAVAVKKKDVVLCLQQRDRSWKEVTLTLDVGKKIRLGTAKAVTIVDVDGDGLKDLIATCESAKDEAEGVVWLQRQKAGPWLLRPLGGPRGEKFDLVQIADLDGDGDPDLMTTDERDALGVVWYENPTRGGGTAQDGRKR